MICTIPDHIVVECAKQILNPRMNEKVDEPSPAVYHHHGHIHSPVYALFGERHGGSGGGGNGNGKQAMERCGGFRLRKNENMFEIYGQADGRVDYQDPARRPMCIPDVADGKPAFVWHTHPKGIYPFPSAEDLAIMAAEEEIGFSLVGFIFTTNGLWMIRRGCHVRTGKIMPPLWHHLHNTVDELNDLVEALNGVVMEAMAMYDATKDRRVTEDIALDFIKQVQEITSNVLQLEFFPYECNQIKAEMENSSIHVQLPCALVEYAKSLP